MSVDRDEVQRIAGLAKLHLDDDEADRLTREMNRILEHAARLRGLATDAPEAEAGTAPERTRGTRPAGADEPDRLLRPLDAFAPDLREGFFVVPPPPGVVHEGGDEIGEGGAARGAGADRARDDGGRADGVTDDGRGVRG